jgi:beta-N-acetylhexosaminidase
MVSIRSRICLARALVGLLLIALLAAPSATPRAQDAESRVDALLASLTLEQKVAQMFLAALYGPTLNAPGRDFLRQWQPGGVALFVSNAGAPDAVARLTNDWQATVVEAGGVPLFIATDQEGGQIARLKDGFTTWPVPMLLTASGDVTLAYQVGEAMARELRAVGVNMNLAPVADLYTNLRNPVIGRRSFGSEPGRTGQMLAGLIRGMQAGGVLATAKHFPGHGDTDRDSHTSLPVVEHPRESLAAVEFAPFTWTIAAGVETIMTAHIWFPALDPAGPLPASLSRAVVSGLLRGELGFDGLVMTDAIEMDAIDTVYSYGEASIMAIEAGSDIIAFGAHLSPDTQGRAIQAVIDAVRAGRLTEARIDESVRRILDAKARYGVLDWTPLDPTTAGLRVNAPAHAALVESLFRAGVTLAYDDGGLLPLDAGRNVALIYPGTRPAVRRACEAYADPARTRWVTFAESPTAEQIAAAAQAAAAADVAVVFTENARANGQSPLVNALPQARTVAVALFSPYDWMAFPEVGAYITTYSPLDPGVPAACSLLYGAITSGARLPVALDGRRDFDNGGASIAFAPTEASPAPLFGTATGAIAVAVAATITPDPALRAMSEAPASPSVAVTATQTLVRVAPISQSGTRGAPLASTPVISPADILASAPPWPTLVPPISTATPQPTLTAQPVEAASPTPVAIAQANPGADAGGGAPTAVIVPPGAPTLPTELWVAGGAFGLAALIYGGMFIGGERARRRYARGFVIARCPACGAEDLEVRAQVKRVMGIADVRHIARCGSCRSVLRQTGPTRWKYRVNPRANPALHARYDGKTVDTRTLRSLERGETRR